jgi:hypothetical protein
MYVCHDAFLRVHRIILFLLLNEFVAGGIKQHEALVYYRLLPRSIRLQATRWYFCGEISAQLVSPHLVSGCVRRCWTFDSLQLQCTGY